jgi:hypothetical protein
LLLLLVPASAQGLHFSVNSDQAAGPQKNIQAALNDAKPGDVIDLAAGVYLQDIKTVRDGRPGQPIIIRGPADAVIKGAGAGRVIEINHDYIEVHGFTIDGRHASEERVESYRDKLIYVVGTGPSENVEGFRAIGMRLRNAGGECLRLRYSTQRSEIAHSTFERCGIYDFVFNDDRKLKPKNGGGVYIGTAIEQIGDWGVPDGRPDNSNENWIHHNTFDTQSNQCVEIKEGSSLNIVEHNRCTGQRDRHEAGLGSRGNRNIFRYNVVYGNRGAGIRVGGHGQRDGIHNDIYGNEVRDNEAGGIKVQRMPQGIVCGNTSRNNKGGAAVGDYDNDIRPLRSCAGQPVAQRGPLSTTTQRLHSGIRQLQDPPSVGTIGKLR